MIDRLKCKLDNLIGKPYGFNYELKDQQLFLVQNTTSNETSKVDINRDNRDLIDKSDNQKLSREEIEELKKLEDANVTIYFLNFGFFYERFSECVFFLYFISKSLAD
jgi:hypothetical protein